MPKIFSFQQYLKENSSPLSPEQISFIESGKHYDASWRYNEKTGLVDVFGDFTISRKEVKKLPVGFGQAGEFSITFSGLESIENLPIKAGKISISNNKISSIENFSTNVSGILNLSNNPLTSFLGCSPDLYCQTLLAYECILFSIEGIDEPSYKSYNFEANPISQEFLLKIYDMEPKDYYSALVERYPGKITEFWDKMDSALQEKIANSQEADVESYSKYIRAKKIIF
jgi:hypothetical protein